MWRTQKPSRHAEGKWVTQKETKSNVNFFIEFLGEREICYHPSILIIHNTTTPPWGKTARTTTSCIWWQRTGSTLRHSLVCTKASSGQITEITEQEQPRRQSLTFWVEVFPGYCQATRGFIAITWSLCFLKTLALRVSVCNLDVIYALFYWLGHPHSPLLLQLEQNWHYKGSHLTPADLISRPMLIPPCRRFSYPDVRRNQQTKATRVWKRKVGNKPASQASTCYTSTCTTTQYFKSSYL